MRCDEEDATDEANDADDGYEHNENNNDDTNDEDDSITLPDIGQSTTSSTLHQRLNAIQGLSSSP